MTKASLTLRIIYTVCLAGATCTHVAFHVQQGILLGGLEAYGYSAATRVFWSLLTLLDPTAAVLLLLRPRAGLVLAAAIIVADVAHNSWILLHFGRGPDAAYLAQVGFLVFLSASVRTAWRGRPRAA